MSRWRDQAAASVAGRRRGRWGRASALPLSALCFVAAAGFIARIRVQETGPAGERAPWRREMADGLRYLAAHRTVGPLVAVLSYRTLLLTIAGASACVGVRLTRIRSGR